MQRLKLQLTDINPGTRIREDYGDLAELMASILKFGLIQPIVITQDRLLVAGGRRYYAHAALLQHGHSHCNEIDVVYKETLDEAHLREMELEENFQRKDMTWQEYTLGVYDFHCLKKRNAHLEGEKWDHFTTAVAIGRSRQRVNQIIPVAEILVRHKENKDHELWRSPSLDEAFKKLLELRQREAEALISAKSLGTSGIQLSGPSGFSAPAGISASIAGMIGFAVPNTQPLNPFNISSGSGQNTSFDSNFIRTESAGSQEKQQLDINLAKYYSHIDCRDWMRQNPDSVDHIICDPPFAINMDMLDQSNGGMDIEKTKDEHDVDENTQLLKEFFPLAFDTVRDGGFVISFCDFMHFSWLVELGLSAGFAVQRWPLIWCKTSAKNQAAGYNFTKATECAVVMRKKKAVLIEAQPRNWWHVDKSPADKDFDHPFAKPQELWMKLINAVSAPGQIVFDPFTGSGSAVAAFIKTGRQWRACERAEQHHVEFLRNITKALTDRFGGSHALNIHYTRE